MTNIINLVMCHNNVFVWSANDWLILRKNYKIVGELVGCLPKHPRQKILSGLPLILLPEEVSLLVEKGFARVIRYLYLQEPPTESLQKTFEEYREKLYIEEEKCLKESKKKQIMTMMDRIVEGKKRKILGIGTSKKELKKPVNETIQQALNNIEVNTKDLLNEQMAKLPKLEKSESLVQTPTAYPWTERNDFEIIEWKYPDTFDEQLRYETFKYFWECGYYVTNGEKFGGDFLIYPGDPIMFHSQCIIQCKQRDEEVCIKDIIAQCRVGSNVRKTLVLATLSENNETIKLQSLQWAGSGIIE